MKKFLTLKVNIGVLLVTIGLVIVIFPNFFGPILGFFSLALFGLGAVFGGAFYIFLAVPSMLILLGFFLIRKKLIFVGLPIVIIIISIYSYLNYQEHQRINNIEQNEIAQDNQKRSEFYQSRAYLGAQYDLIDQFLKKEKDLSVDYGALINYVRPDSPADKVGIVKNDIILEVDGIKPTSTGSLVADKKIGDVINILILHNGIEKSIRVTLEAFPPN